MATYNLCHHRSISFDSPWQPISSIIIIILIRFSFSVHQSMPQPSLDMGTKTTVNNLNSSIDPVAGKYMVTGPNRDIVPTAVAKYGDNPTKVRDWYLDSFRDLRSFPDIKDIKDGGDFTQMIKLIKVRHNNVVPAMALEFNS